MSLYDDTNPMHLEYLDRHRRNREARERRDEQRKRDDADRTPA